MNRDRKTLLKKYIITFFIGGVLAYAYVALRDFRGEPLLEKYRILCDAFTIPGLLLLMVGLLVAVSNEGIFDGLLYALSYAAKAIIPLWGRQHERYYDYVQRKREKRLHGYGFLFITGAVFMAAAMVFLILFYSIYE